MFVLCCLVLVSAVSGQLGGDSRPIPSSEFNSDAMNKIHRLVAEHFTQEFNEMFYYGGNLHLQSATRQVVSGYLYHLTYTLDGNSLTRTCVVDVWEQPWLDSRVVTSTLCNPRMKRQTGVETTGSLSNEAKSAADWAAKQYNMMSNNMYVSCLVDVSNVKQQLVAGMIYTMDIVLKDSTIRKGTDGVTAVSDGCVTDTMARTRSCHMKVWDQSWRTPRYQLSEHHCVDLAS